LNFIAAAYGSSVANASRSWACVRLDQAVMTKTRSAVPAVAAAAAGVGVGGSTMKAPESWLSRP
jgi:hypothetical protein